MELKEAIAALKEGLESAPVDVSREALELIVQKFDAPASPELIDKARELYGDDDCEIDSDATISDADGGTWVSAWVWVAKRCRECNEVVSEDGTCADPDCDLFEKPAIAEKA